VLLLCFDRFRTELPRLLSVLRRRSDAARVTPGSPSRRREPQSRHGL